MSLETSEYSENVILAISHTGKLYNLPFLFKHPTHKCTVWTGKQLHYWDYLTAATSVSIERE